jgi:DNA polymerase-1
MKTISVDTEYDYDGPFLATVTDDQLKTSVFRLKERRERERLASIVGDNSIRKVFHHAVADIYKLSQVGIKVRKPYECTLILSNLVNEQFSSRNLKELAKAHLGIETKEANRLNSVIKKYKERARKEGREFRWSEIPDEYIIPYAKRDTEYTIKLWFYWQEPLKEVRKLYEFEKSLIPIIVKMQKRGMKIDRYLVLKTIQQYERKLVELENKIKQITEGLGVKDFNIRSVPQLRLVFEKLGIETVRDPKTGELSTAKSSLQAVNHPFVDLLLRYRFFKKHLSTYYLPLYSYYTSPTNSRAHFMLYQTGAKTGRFSAELIQTFPRPEEAKVAGEKHEVRKVVIPKKGYVILCKDYEQQEMRLFIHYSNCQRMIDIINEGGGRGIDCYEETAKILFGKLYREPYSKPLRYIAKQCSLGMIYGEGQRKLISTVVAYLNSKFDKEVIERIGVSERWARQVLESYYRLYPVKPFMQQKIAEVYRTGVLKMSFDSSLMNFSRVYHVPHEFAYRAVNMLIQGTAAYIIKHAMVRIENRIKKEGLQKEVRMLMQVHDELIFEVSKSLDIKEVDRILSEEMEDHITFKVPITTSMKWSEKSWGDVV